MATGNRQLATPQTSGPVKHGARQYGPPPAAVIAAPQTPHASPPPAAMPPTPAPPAAKPKPPKKPKAKADPQMVAAARELRDRYLEHLNSGAMAIEGAGKYDVARALPAASVTAELKGLPHAA